MKKKKAMCFEMLGKVGHRSVLANQALSCEASAESVHHQLRFPSMEFRCE